MTLYYAGIQLSAEVMGGDWIESFLPSMEAQVQVVQPIRAKTVRVIGRDNRAWSLPFRLHLGPRASSGAMFAYMCLLPSSLPAEGAILCEESGQIIQIVNGAFKGFTPQNRVGVSAWVDFSFLAGGDFELVTNALQADSGDLLLTDSGEAILTN